MPWRFLVFLVVLALVVAFAGLNVAHRADVSFGFYTFEDVPVFLSVAVAYLLGALTILPFTLSKSYRKRRKLSKQKSEQEKKALAKAAQSGHAAQSVHPAETAGGDVGASATGGKTGVVGRRKKKRSKKGVTDVEASP